MKIRLGLLALMVVLFGFEASVRAAESSASLEDRIKALEEKVARNDALEKKVEALARENEALKSKINLLEGRVTEVKAAAFPVPMPVAPAVTASPVEKPKTILDTIKVKGRFAAGFLKSGQGSDDYATRPAYSHGSFEVPEAKVQISLEPDRHNTVVMRANLNDAKFNSLDYFYLESKDFLPQLVDTPYTFDTRIGRFKLPYGEEMHTNNLVESAVGSNSASNAAGYEQGLQLSGKIGRENPLKWYAAISNGNGNSNGVGAGDKVDNMAPKAYTAKLAYSPMAPLSLSGSVYTSGGLGTDYVGIPVAGLNTKPGGSSGWSRTLWEADARWDIEKGKITDSAFLGAFCDSRAYVRGAFGQMIDEADVVSDREANYGFVEGLWNFDPKWYAAARYSLVDMMHGQSATLNNLNNCTRYDRYSVALGYRFSERTIIRASYDFNVKNTLSGIDPPDDLFMLTMGSEF